MAIKRFFNVLLVLGLLRFEPNCAAPEGRVLGGEDVQPGDFPWVVSVRVFNTPVCAGSIITEHFILTAAHCVFDINPSSIAVRAGSTNQFAGGHIADVSSTYIHPLYGNLLNDVALLGLKNPLKFNDKINQITYAANNEIVPDKAKIYVAGWGLSEGSVSPYKLRQTIMSVLDPVECEKEAGFGFMSVLCLKHPAGVGICSGDDGAGAMAVGKLVGVVSFAFGRCGTGFPDIATKVSYYTDWIDSVVLNKTLA